MATQAYLDMAQEFYIGYYGRPADPAGLEYWADKLEASSNLDDVLTQFGTSAEFTENFGSLTNTELVNNLYQQMFGRDAEQAGIDFYAGLLDDGEATLASIAKQIIDGAAGDDATVLANKVAVSQTYTSAVTSLDSTYEADDIADAQAILDAVDATGASVTAGNAAAVAEVTSNIPVGPVVPGDDFLLTADTDGLADFTGTANDDFYDAPITQNPWAGGVSNSLSTADRLDGGAGTDTLHAELVPEFYGVTGDNQMDVQPRIQSIEDIKIEAMDVSSAFNNGAVIVDAKNIADVVKIGSYFSDGDLSIENITTLTADGTARNTDTITITMDHTDNFNTDGDASDLTAYFDEDYLLSDQSVQSQAIYYLLDQDADMNDTDVDGDGVVDLLANINTNGLIFTIDGGEEMVLEFDQALLTDGTILNHEDFVAALQASLDVLIAAGDVPADTTLTVDTTMTRTTFLDDGSVSSLIPAIVLESQSTTGLESVGFAWVEDLSGEFNVYGRLEDDEGINDNPVAINVELHKVGRNDDGGDLFIGGKANEGIPDFYVDVLGADDKPSSLGTITTNINDLDNVYISTHADYVDGDSFASLTVRNGFVGQASVDLVDADDFYGDLTLGSVTAVNDLVVLEARGGGDVRFTGLVDGTTAGADDVLANNGRAYSYTTGSGNDTIAVTLDGDAVDAGGVAPESFAISTGSGADVVRITSAAGVSQQTMFILDNLSINTGSGDDRATINGYERFDIATESGDDYVEITSVSAVDGSTGAWTFGATTGVQPFVDRVLYDAELTVTFAGFESTVSVETDAAGNFVADQETINAAIIDAIDQSEVLSELLDYNLGTSDQFLMITSDFDGANQLSIDLFQPTLVAANAAAGQTVLSTSDITSIRQGIINTTALTSADLEDAAEIIAEFNDGTNANLGDGSLAQNGNDISTDQYDYRFQAANADGTADAVVEENYSVINTGTGDDIVVLHSNDVSANTLVFDSEFNKLTVVNFFDDAALTVTGNHILDFTHYLNNQQDPSNAPAGNAQSTVAIPVTYAGPVTAAAGADLVGNEFTIVKATFDADDTFAGLTASNFLAAINGDDATSDYADIDNGTLDAADSPFGVNFVGTVQDNIVFVENNFNRGEYKVFYLTSELDANGNVDNNDGDFDSAALLGTIDFGAAITGDPISEANLWGSADPTGDGTTSWGSFYLNDVITGGDEAVNTAPDAEADAFDATTGVAADLDVLANDDDVDGDAVVFDTTNAIVVSGTGATAEYDVVDNDINFTATTAGTYTFEYAVMDNNGGSDTATVTVTVTDAAAGQTVVTMDALADLTEATAYDAGAGDFLFQFDTDVDLATWIDGFGVGDTLSFTNTPTGTDGDFNVTNPAFNDNAASVGVESVEIGLTGIASDLFNDATSFEAIYGADSLVFAV